MARLQAEAETARTDRDTADARLITALEALNKMQEDIKNVSAVNQEISAKYRMITTQHQELIDQNEDLMSFMSENLGFIGPRMERDHGRHAASRDLRQEMDQQDEAYRKQRCLDADLPLTAEELEEELRNMSGPDWETTAKKIEAKEANDRGEASFTYPRTAARWTSEVMTFLNVPSSHPIMKQASQRLHGSSKVPCSKRMRQYLLAESLKRLPQASALRPALIALHEVLFNTREP